MAKSKSKAKRKAKAKAAPIPNVCATLSGAIKLINKDLASEEKAIATQQSLIQQLKKQNANPKLIQQAEDRLASLQQQHDDDEGQLAAFQNEFDAECR